MHPMQVLTQADTFPDVTTLGSALGWDLGFRQLDPGDASVPAEAVMGEHWVLTRMRFGRRYHQLGQPPSGLITVGVPLTGLNDWFGRPYAQRSILPFNHPDGIDGTSERDFEAMTFSISECVVQEVASALQVPLPKILREPRSDSIVPDSNETRDFRALLRGVFAGPFRAGCADFPHEAALRLLLAGQPGRARVDRSAANVRYRAVRKALDYIADHEGEAVTVRELCAATGVPVRTLNRAFNERFDIGPKAYLKRQRLAGVRRSLLSAHPTAVIADIANRWGFWHLGQFARDYRSTFGELPSETLRNQGASEHWPVR